MSRGLSSRHYISQLGEYKVRILTCLFILIIILFGITFATLNSSLVSINYYFGEDKLPLSLLLVLTFALGSVITIVVSALILIKAKLVNYRLKQKLSLAEKEIENLRAIPLQDKV